MSTFRKRLSENAGFTLIELLVVIAVLGILAGIAVPRLTGVRDKAEVASAKSDMRNIQTAAESYYAENGDYDFDASDLQEFVGEGIDVGVNGGSADYSVTSESSIDGVKITANNVEVDSGDLILTPGGFND